MKHHNKVQAQELCNINLCTIHAQGDLGFSRHCE